MNVLIAHPDPASRRLLRVMLEEMGHRVLATVDDPAAILDFAIHAPPDLVLCGIGLDDTVVPEILRRLLEIRYLPVIVVVQRQAIELAEAMVAKEAMGYLVEPFTCDDLRPLLQSVMRRFQELTQLRAENLRLKWRLGGGTFPTSGLL